MGGTFKKFGKKLRKINKNNSSRYDDIAIIGMACRFPGANNYHEFWNNLISGVNSIKEIPISRWDVNKYYSPDIDAPNKSVSKWCGTVDSIDKFDDRFFNISPREAKSMDPQQRLLLEEAWHCIEDSGVALSHLQKKRTSVYIGVMAIDYYGEAATSGETDGYACLGNYECILANRLSYYLGLSGASLSLDAACAASLIALHEAKTSLRLGETDYAIAGGVSLNFHPFKYISFSKSRMLSPDGQCKTFDAAANGYVPGDGVGVLLLQRLEDAIRDGNHVYGVIKGSAVNHTGPALSITAPRVEAQREVILAAYADADINPETISYLEAHGTGTSLGDPIEVESLTKAFRVHTEKREYCGIGSVKSNIGHLEAAAGVAGVIKVLLMMNHRQIPRTLNITSLNPIINFDDTPFKVAMMESDWRPTGGSDLLRAGVSSFGFGGANSHMVLEEYCDTSKKSDKLPKSGEPFILSARTAHSLSGLITEWKKFLKNDGFNGCSLGDICLTSLTGRASFMDRVGCIVKNREDLLHFVNEPGHAITAETDRAVCFALGNISIDSFDDLKPFIEENERFRAHIETLQTIMQANDVNKEVLGRFRKKRWPEKYRSLFRFVVQYAYALTYIDAGVKPDLIMARGSGAWTGLVVSKAVEFADAVMFLYGTKHISEIGFQRPNVPFYDSLNARIIKPYKIDEKYLYDLLDDLDVEERGLVGKILVEEIAHSAEGSPGQGATKLGQLLLKKNIITDEQLSDALRTKDKTHHLLGAILVEKGYCTLKQIEESLAHQDILRGIVDKARSLQNSQFTFKKYLEEWDEILSKSGKKLSELLYNENLLASAGNDWSRERLLLLVIIISSLRKLNKKWNLSEQALVSDARFYEFLDLLLDNVLPKDRVVKLLCDEHRDYRSCADVIDSHQHLIDPSHDYTFLKKHSKNLSEIKDVSSWVKGLEEAKWPPAMDDKYLRLLIDSEEYPGKSMRGSSEGSQQNSSVISLDKNVYAKMSGDIAGEFKEALLELWLRGIDVTWGTLYRDGSFNKTSLPTYAFQHKSFWLHKGDAVSAAAHPGEERQLNVSGGDGSVHYIREFKVGDQVVHDHVITGKHLIPAASMIDLGFDAGARIFNRPINALRNIAIQHPGVVEASVTLDVNADASKKEFTVLSVTERLAMGKFDDSEFVPLPAINISSLKRGQRLSVEAIYNAFMRAGYQYGKGLQVISSGWRSGDTYLFELSDLTEEKCFQSKLNARLLDGLFQSVLAVEYLAERDAAAGICTFHI